MTINHLSQSKDILYGSQCTADVMARMLEVPLRGTSTAMFSRQVTVGAETTAREVYIIVAETVGSSQSLQNFAICVQAVEAKTGLVTEGVLGEADYVLDHLGNESSCILFKKVLSIRPPNGFGAFAWFQAIELCVFTARVSWLSWQFWCGS